MTQKFFFNGEYAKCTSFLEFISLEILPTNKFKDNLIRVESFD